MRGEFYQQLTNDLETARAEGLFKEERIITSAPQSDQDDSPARDSCWHKS